MKDFQALSIGGVNVDKDPRSLQPNELSYAQDVEIFSTVAGQDTSASPLPSSANIYNIPVCPTQSQYVRLNYDNAAFVSYYYTITDSSGGYILNNVAIAVGANATAHVALISTAISGAGYAATLGNAPMGEEWFSMKIEQSSTPVVYNIEQSSYDGTTITPVIVYTLQEAFNPVSAAVSNFQTLQTQEMDGMMFLWSRSVGLCMGSNYAYQIGYAVKNQSGVWAYTQLVLTTKFGFPTNKVIEIQSEEINSGQYAFYWIDDTNKPKVVYVPTTLVENGILKYTLNNFLGGLEGLFTLDSIDIQTDLQIQNPARVNWSSQLETGGALEAGTDFYFVAVGINNNWSEWSPASEPITVFKASTTAPSAGAYIGGDKSVTVTSKANVVLITGADARAYNTIRLACLTNQGGAYSAVIVGEYAVTANEFYITHTGLESGSTVLDASSLPPVQDVFLSARNIQNKKNRLNLADVEIANDADLEDIFQAVTLGQTTDNLDSVGIVTFTSEALFKASTDVGGYVDSRRDQQRIKLNNDSTLGNFDNGGYFVNTFDNYAFTVPTTGNYSLSIYLRGGGRDPVHGYLGPVNMYVLNYTTGTKSLLVEM